LEVQSNPAGVHASETVLLVGPGLRVAATVLAGPVMVAVVEPFTISVFDVASRVRGGCKPVAPLGGERVSLRGIQPIKDKAAKHADNVKIRRAPS